MRAPDKRIIELRLTRENLEKRIHELASAGEASFSEHAYDRMDERGISDIQVERALRTGHISGEIVPGSRPGEWKCKVVERMKGMRDIGVVTIVIHNARLFIKTVEWEDMK